MNDINKTISNIELKARQLTHRLHEILEENQALKTENQRLNNTIEELNIKNKTLTENNKIHHIAGVVSGKKTNTTEAKRKINEFVREIDKCISLLNQ
ncbi:MAG: hypothetical protein WCH34_11080 [Bacteroidota bacterium]